MNNWTAIAALALLQVPRIGRKTALKVMEALQSSDVTEESLSHAIAEARLVYPRIPNASPNQIDIAVHTARNIVSEAHQHGLVILMNGGDGFPEQLAHIPDPPVALFVKGDPQCLSCLPSVAIVGTRSPTKWGRDCAYKCGKQFASANALVVSGLALGCDTAAHQGCLAGGGKTVAVLAHGLANVYPKRNAALAQQIIEHGGCLVSEYEPQTEPRGSNFVDRDRLQTGLSGAVVVIETDLQGGTMHTVGFAQQQGRIIACIASHPEELLNASQRRGNNKLLHDNIAIPLSDTHDLDALLAKLPVSGTPQIPNNLPRVASDHVASQMPMSSDPEDVP